MENVTVIVDAKYKRHWEELQDGGWSGQTDELRERHRADLLQVLAYANLVGTRDVVCCLVYPCSMTTWESLVRRGRLFHQSELPNRGRRVRVWLTAMPMCVAAELVASPFQNQLRSIQA
jgi:5-methylcytosine-specific restriction endonuclease McrBC regulatory subunit McrC